MPDSSRLLYDSERARSPKIGTNAAKLAGESRRIEAKIIG